MPTQPYRDFRSACRSVLREDCRARSSSPHGASTRCLPSIAAAPSWMRSCLMALEGDQAGGVLLLEGDMQSGTDALKLEGDAVAIGGTVTKRVAGPV